MARVMVTIPDDFLMKVDEAARGEHMKRSELFREALRKWLSARGPVDGAEALRARRLRVLDEMAEFRAAHPPIAGAPDSVEIIRQMRGPLT